MGFSANPPHFGHLEMARLVLNKKLADEIWLIPCFRHPFDKDLASAEHRWRMTKLLEDKNKKAKDIEIKQIKKNYTITTATKLKRKYPNYEFFWIIGSDIVKTGSYKK